VLFIVFEIHAFFFVLLQKNHPLVPPYMSSCNYSSSHCSTSCSLKLVVFVVFFYSFLNMISFVMFVTFVTFTIMIVFVMFMIIVCKPMVCVTFIFVIIISMISIHGILIHDDVRIVHRPKCLAF
jgi:hypothetical protein